MIDEKKIERAQEEIFEDRFHFNGEYVTMTDDSAEPYMAEMYDKRQLMHAVGLGVHWAIEEFLKGLWHDASEEPNPQLNAWIVLQSGKDLWEIVKYSGYNEDGCQTWQREAEKGHILRWCYLSDILPQKGGNNV